MADDRPTPRYGEIAPDGWGWSPPTDPHAAPPSDESGADEIAGEPQRSPQLYRIADATLSVFLLVMAVMFSSSTVPGLFALRGTVDMLYSARGLGEYGGGSAVDIAGAVAAIAQLVLLAGAIWLTVRLIA